MPIFHIDEPFGEPSLTGWDCWISIKDKGESYIHLKEKEIEANYVRDNLK